MAPPARPSMRYNNSNSGNTSPKNSAGIKRKQIANPSNNHHSNHHSNQHNQSSSSKTQQPYSVGAQAYAKKARQNAAAYTRANAPRYELKSFLQTSWIKSAMSPSGRLSPSPPRPTHQLSFDSDAFSFELEHFASYVRPSPIEVAAREFLVKTVVGLVDGEKKFQKGAFVEPFGSYAAKGNISLYSSDVDMAIYGAIEVFQDKRGSSILQKMVLKQRDERKNAKLERWRAIINGSDSDTSKTEQSVVDLSTNSDDEGLEDDFVGDISSDESEGGDDDETFAEVIELNSDGEEEDFGFQIDRAGDDNIESTIPFDDDADTALIASTATIPSATSTSTSTAITSSASTVSATSSNASNNNNNNKPKAVPETDLDLDDYDKDASYQYEEDDSTIELNTTSSSINFTGDGSDESHQPQHISESLRKDIIKTLRLISRLLVRCNWCDNLQLRSKAKVPIITFKTTFGVEGDVGIGGHTGVDTSDYASSLALKYPCFSAVILVLKQLLKQRELDKPFTGGIGSFKLYVMLAHHLDELNRTNTLADSNTGEVLLSFLARYGTGSKLISLHQGTVLKAHGGVADFKAAFKLEDVCYLFKWAQDQLHKCSRASRGDKNSLGINKQTHPPLHNGDRYSFLATIIDEEELIRERNNSIRLAGKASLSGGANSSFSRSTFNPNAPVFNSSSNQQHQHQQQQQQQQRGTDRLFLPPPPNQKTVQKKRARAADFFVKLEEEQQPEKVPKASKKKRRGAADFFGDGHEESVSSEVQYQSKEEVDEAKKLANSYGFGLKVSEERNGGGGGVGGGNGRSRSNSPKPNRSPKR